MPRKSRSVDSKERSQSLKARQREEVAARDRIARPRLGLDAEELIWAYRQMVRARLTDEKIIVLYKQNKCHFQIGTAGHEAVQVAAARCFRPGVDWFYPYYRDMALCAALGMSSREFMLNAMNKADDPNSHGRQMPMHYGSKALRIPSQSSPTGTQFLQATGCALGAKIKGLPEVVYVSAGEGTCSQGDFHEALNWAARDLLPVIFLIQNNDFAISVHISEQLAGASVTKISYGYEGLHAEEVDGTDYVESRRVLQAAYTRALEGGGPSLIEAHVPRLQSHSISDNHLKYRTSDQIAKDYDRDPITAMELLLVKHRIAEQEQLASWRSEIQAEVDGAAEWAELQAAPSPESALDHSFVSANPADGIEERDPDGNEVFMVDALNHALDQELEREPDMYIFGQDVAYGKGGVFTVTSNLTDRHGAERVFNAPLAESSIVGVSIGMATRGLKPVPEIQFGDYVWTGMMQIRNELALMHYRSGGDWSCPVVIRIPVGGYIHGGCYHSQNIEGTFAHFPGLFVVYPSNASDAHGLLKAAIRGSDPVLFLEHKGLYRQPHAKGREGGSDYLVPLGKAKVVHPGTDLTIITYGYMVQKALLVAKQLAGQGRSIEVIDLRTIVPFDQALVFSSVDKTGRALVVHEDLKFMGFGAEVAAQIADRCFRSLDAPVGRVGMKYAAAVPHAPGLEAAVLPNEGDILAEAERLLKF